MKKNIIALFFIILIAGGLVFYFKYYKQPTPTEVKTDESSIVSMCYYYADKTRNDTEDREWVRLDIDGGKVTGEHYYVPAEKDSKVGNFEGTVGAFDSNISGRVAEVTWTAMAEGTENKEELLIEFGEGSAVALFGEMVDKGDGTYAYKDKTKVTPGFPMWQMDCATLTAILEDRSE